MKKYILCIFLQAYTMVNPMVLEPDTEEMVTGPIPIVLYIGINKVDNAIKLSVYLGSTYADLREKLIASKKRSFKEFIFIDSYGKKIILEKETELIEGQPYILFCAKRYGKTD